MAKTKTISVTFRCPEDLYNALSNFALDHNIIKDDKPIISEALIAALRIGLGADSNTDVSQPVRQLDIKAMINEAINSRFIIIESKVQNLQSDRTSEKTEALLIETLQTNLAIANHRIDDLSAKIAALTTENKAPANSTQSPTSKSEGTSTPNASKISLESDTLPIIEAIANIEDPVSENALPDITNVPVKPKAIRRSPKSKPKYTRDQLAKMKLPEIRSVYRDAIPFSDRNNEKHTKAEYATRDFMVEAILKAKTKS